MTRAILLLLGCAACAGTRVYTPDIADAFERDFPGLEERAPDKEDLNPARAANAPDVMRETERVARAYLERRGGEGTPGAYGRALLACALLAQGRTVEARDTMRGLKPRDEWELTRENIVIAGTIHATSVCRSVQAREAAEEFLAGRLAAEEFVRKYASFAGLPLSAPDAPEYGKMVKLAAKNLVETCAPGVAEPGEEAAKARTELRRVLGEQVYNDAASLLVRLSPPPEKAPRPADQVWLAKVAVKSITIYRFLIPDMLPMPLSREQKEWQREQAYPVFKNARDLAGWFLTAADRTRIEETRAPQTPDEVLYDRLLSAQLEVLAWIDLR